MNDWAFAQIDTDRFLLFEGPLTAHEQPNDGETMLYAPGYFLRDGPSWISGSRCCFLSRKEWEARFPRVDVKNDWGVVCGRPDKTAFKDAFDRLQELFSRGVLKKGVPATVATGTIRWSRTLAEHWLHKAGTLRSNLYSYGLRYADVGVIGATPEVLFETKAGVLRTMALAGTRPAADTAELGESPKDLHEHELVKDFLREVLSPFGKVAIGQTGVRDFGQLHHLHTPVSVTLDCAPSFEGLVASLHPTPALGTSPRCPEGEAWLRQMDAAVPRGRYGSPFGVRFGNGDMLCLVAIRNMQFSGNVLRVWSGCGVVPTSQFENEWSEICVKSETILKTWDVQMNASL